MAETDSRWSGAVVWRSPRSASEKYTYLRLGERGSPGTWTASVVLEGTLATDKDFGSGYRYSVILEDARLLSELPRGATAP